VSPLQWCRWADRGEFWDAWDLAANYRSQPLPLRWDGPPELAETGPLCVRLVWRGLCGCSPLRLDVVLRAASPYLELTLAVDWHQVHELLRLELPLAQAALRLAADTSGGVIERPAAAITARERSRWEVPVISWLAAEAAGSGLAVLLDGPQGVSGTPERLGVSLLRAPTWPDPAADNGWQRLRLALVPCPQGWCRAALPQEAVRFREPLWRRPLAGVAQLPAGLPDLGSHLQLLGLRPCSKGSGAAVLSVQNLSPLRQGLNLGPAWRLLERLDGLGRPLDPQDQSSVLAPWATGFWRLAPVQSS
jgi:alpha-mannosidase